MKKMVLLFLLFIWVGLASNSNLIKASLFSWIVELLERDNPYVQIYIDSKEYQDIPKYVKKYHFTRNCLDADLLFVDTIKDLPKECIYGHKVFVTKYIDFVQNRDKVVGAFFLQKGRPTLIFNKRLLKYFGIVLPPKYDKYID